MRPTQRNPDSGVAVLRWDLDHLRDAAVARAAATPVLRRTMRGREANEVGALGELVALDYLTTLGVDAQDTPTTGYDLTTPFGTIDVKTKERSVRPRPDYDCTVADYVLDHQRPSWYLFVSLESTGGKGMDRFTTGWVLGTISRAEFERASVEWTPADRDTTNGWVPTIACHNVRVRDLRPPRALT